MNERAEHSGPDDTDHAGLEGAVGGVSNSSGDVGTDPNTTDPSATTMYGPRGNLTQHEARMIEGLVPTATAVTIGVGALIYRLSRKSPAAANKITNSSTAYTLGTRSDHAFSINRADFLAKLKQTYDNEQVDKVDHLFDATDGSWDPDKPQQKFADYQAFMHLKLNPEADSLLPEQPTNPTRVNFNPTTSVKVFQGDVFDPDGLDTSTGETHIGEFKEGGGTPINIPQLPTWQGKLREDGPGDVRFKKSDGTIGRTTAEATQFKQDIETFNKLDESAIDSIPGGDYESKLNNYIALVQQFVADSATGLSLTNDHEREVWNATVRTLARDADPNDLRDGEFLNFSKQFAATLIAKARSDKNDPNPFHGLPVLGGNDDPRSNLDQFELVIESNPNFGQDEAKVESAAALIEEEGVSSLDLPKADGGTTLNIPDKTASSAGGGSGKVSTGLNTGTRQRPLQVDLKTVDGKLGYFSGTNTFVPVTPANDPSDPNLFRNGFGSFVTEIP